ncbi:hypothetical protein K438DRAFT_1974234 [Mycena galopus ATCC 62051]|nr:hypothetical protein K438DRAFT_1974234 [Mycena galopus ATCC 62051]
MLALVLESILFVTLLQPTSVNGRLTGDLGSFASPKTGVKWRYWIQDASVDLDIVHSDVAAIATVGSSGFELLSYQTYGGSVLLNPTDYAYGSQRFVDVAAVAVQAAIDNDVTIDFAMGPNQGAGVPVFPTDVDMEGMLTELCFGSIFLDPGEEFSGALPNPTIFPDVKNNGTPSANINTMALVSAVIAELVTGADPTFFRVSLQWDTVQDLTSQVDQSLNLLFTAPSAPSVLLAYYPRRDGYPEAEKGFAGSFLNEPGSWGSYVVDHFSSKGADVSIKFIEQNIISQEGIGGLAAGPNVGGYMWEDSMEFWAQLFWTDGFPQRFLERHGYEINKTLPVVSTISTGFAPKPSQSFDFGTTVDPQRFLEDYQDTLTSLYVDYMQTFRNRSHTVGFQYSNQPGYNFHLEVAASAAVADAPEIETLAIGTARQLSGGVHLGNYVIMSSELGANYGQAGSIRMADLLNDAYVQHAGGAERRAHPWFPLFGPYNWLHMHGVAKVDAAIYRKDYDVTAAGFPPFQGDSLINAGYSYEYISPENFKLPGVSISNGRACSILQYSKAGLPIVISGPVPDDLVKQANVKVVIDETQVPAALISLGVLPALSVSTSAGIYSIHRDTEDVTFFWLYHPQFSIETFTLSLKPDIIGTPFILNAWTATVSPVALWTNSEGTISIPNMTLVSSQTMLFAVTSARTFEGVGVPSTHLVALDSPASVVVDTDGNIEVQSSSDGRRTTRNLSGWQLSIVAWTPPANLSVGAAVQSVLVTQPTFNLTQGLVLWDTLEGQTNTSGVGTYSTTFQWKDHDTFVNDVQIPTADPTSPVVDITQFVVNNGENTLRAEVASTLLNALNGATAVETLGDLRTVLSINPANEGYGLLDPVQLIPYGRAPIKL